MIPSPPNRRPYRASQAHPWRSALLCALSVLWGAATASAQQFKAPYVPTDEAEVLQEVPSSKDPAVARMKSLRMGFDAAPKDLSAALALSDAYVDYGRQIGDAHYAGYAEAVLEPWLSAPGAPASVLVTQATILQYRHLFDEARALLLRALKLDPRNAQGWLTLATLDMVQGDYPTAGKDCAQVTNTGGLPYGMACAGNLRSYVGQARQSLALLQQAAAGSGKMQAGYQAWLQGLLAETAERLGDWASVEDHYQRALALLPQDNFLLVAYADFLLDRGRPNEVVRLLAGHEQSDTAYLRIALAQAALGSADVQRYTWIMAARFEALRLRGSDYFGREQSRFALLLLHDPQGALDLAQKNWQVQRAPWDVRIVLEAALAAKRPHAADEVLAFVEKTKLEDPLIEALVRQLRSRPS